jgi:hypothetical protein
MAWGQISGAASRRPQKPLEDQGRYVELTDTLPVQEPGTEIVGQMVFADFLALLDERQRQGVVPLHSRVTKLTTSRASWDTAITARSQST